MSIPKIRVQCAVIQFGDKAVYSTIFVNANCNIHVYAALRQRLDVDEGPGDLLDPVECQTAGSVRHRLLQTVRSAVSEMYARNLWTLHVVPGRSRQSKISTVLSFSQPLLFLTPKCIHSCTFWVLLEFKSFTLLGVYFLFLFLLSFSFIQGI